MTMPAVSVGPANALVDVAGLRVGHHTATSDGFLTGTTVVLAPDGGMVAGVDVRGGGPGTRETDLLAPTASVERVHAIVLTGGSAYGLAAASGVADALGEWGIGLPVGALPGQVVPIVPAAVLFDLGRGGDFGARPGPEFGRAAAQAARDGDPAGMARCGCVGAGAGAVAGGLKGAVGNASATLPDGTTVAALVVANAVGSAVDPRTGRLWAAASMLPGDGPAPGTPSPQELAALLAAAAARPTAPAAGRYGPTVAPGAGAAADGSAPDAADRDHPAAGGGIDPGAAANTVLHTTIGVLATDAALTKTQCTKLAAVGHDGLARAVNPIHTLFDGDTLFAVATGSRTAPDLLGYQAILGVAADVVTRAMARALLAASGVQTAGGAWPSYADLAPTAMGASGRS
jgi:putative pantetheine hydrolase